MTHNQYHKNGSGETFLAFMVGALAATAIGGYFLFGPNGRKNRDRVETWVEDAKTEILDKMKKLENISRDQYNKIVDEVGEKYSMLTHVGKEKANQLRDEFREKWDEMKRTAEEAKQQAKKEMDAEERA